MIRQQLIYVLASFTAGMLIVLVYDVLLIIQEIIRCGKFLIALVDIIYWILAGIAVYYHVMYRFNEGGVRGYAAGVMVLGMIIMQWSVGGRMVTAMTKIIARIRNYLHRKLPKRKKRQVNYIAGKDTSNTQI